MKKIHFFFLVTIFVCGLAAAARPEDARLLALRDGMNDWLRSITGRADIWDSAGSPLKSLTEKMPGIWDAVRGALPAPDAVPVVFDIGAARYGPRSAGNGARADESDMLVLHAAFGKERVATFGFDISAGKAAELVEEAARLGIDPRFFSIEERGISDETGRATVYAKRQKDAKNLYSLVPGGTPLYDIDVTTLKDFVDNTPAVAEHLRGNPIFYVKVDTEGAEPIVLRGMRTLLAEGRVLMASFEYALFWGEVFSETVARRGADLYMPIGKVPHPTLRAFQHAVHDIGGYTLFLVARGNLVPLSGIWWDSSFEICLEPRRVMHTPEWCVTDVLAIKNDPALMRAVLEAHGVQYDIDAFLATLE